MGIGWFVFIFRDKISSKYIAVKSPAMQKAMIFSDRMSYALYLCHMTIASIMIHFLHEYSLPVFLAGSAVASFLLLWVVSVMGSVFAWR